MKEEVKEVLTSDALKEDDQETRLDASHVRHDFRALCKKAGIEGV